MPTTTAVRTTQETPAATFTHGVRDGNTYTLRRYTTLPSLLHVLHNEQITLLSPASWDDRNDVFFMNQYGDRKGAKSVLALCFSMALETYHHWRVFTHGSEGVCIEFERQTLLARLNKEEGLRASDVEYKRIEALEAERPLVDALPFLKRLPYEDEQEFRLVYLSRSEVVEAKSFHIDLKSIRRITLSPWMPRALVTPVITTIRSIAGCPRMKVSQTRLLENERWKRTALQEAKPEGRRNANP
ncbi:MAG: DUF2971 domain-containing protein [Terriglobales bacterium]